MIGLIVHLSPRMRSHFSAVWKNNQRFVSPSIRRPTTQDERFSILTRFAIAKELERTGQVTDEDVVQVSLPIGVPPKH